MLVVVAALLFQFSVFSPSNIQAAEKAKPTTPLAAKDLGSVNKPGSPTVSGTQEVLTAANSANAGVPVAFAPGRLVAEPIVATTPAPAAPVVNPASPVAIAPAAVAPVYGPAYSRIYGPPIRAVSDRRQSREWLALSFAAHSAAGFDAWSTRRVISSVPNAEEMNPFLKPFAGNASMYAAVQVLPTVLDFVSRRMMNSRNEFLRHTWWLPQAVSAVVSVSSGVHNMGVYNSR
jgi:hypothetical protein